MWMSMLGGDGRARVRTWCALAVLPHNTVKIAALVPAKRDVAPLPPAPRQRPITALRTTGPPGTFYSMDTKSDSTTRTTRPPGALRTPSREANRGAGQDRRSEAGWTPPPQNGRTLTGRPDPFPGEVDR